MRKTSAIYAAGMIVVAGAVGTVAAETAMSQTFPAVNGSCISPLTILEAAQAAEGSYNGISVNGQYVPIEAALTGPQLYASTEGCAPDGTNGNGPVPPGDDNSTTTSSSPDNSTTTAPPTTLAPTTTTLATTTTTVAPTTTTVPPVTTTTRDIDCRVWHRGHWWVIRCHR